MANLSASDLGSAIGALLSLVRGSGPSPTQGLNSLDPRLVNMLLQTMQMQNTRLASVEPIHQAAMAMAMRMAPAYARNAVTSNGQPPAVPPAPTSGGLNPAAAAALGAGGMGLLDALLGGKSGGSGNLPIQKLIDLLRGGPSVQGNKPFPGGGLVGPATADPTRFLGWPPPDSSNSPTPNVTTSEDFSFPPDILNDPSLLNSLLASVSDPSGGSGIGPGMQDYYGGGTSGGVGGGDYGEGDEP